MATDPTIMKLRLAAINRIISAIPVWPNTKGMAEWEKYSKIGMSEVAGLVRAELSNLPKGYNKGEPSLKTEAKRRFLKWRENQAKGEWKTLTEAEQRIWEGYVIEDVRFGEIRARELVREEPPSFADEVLPVGSRVELVETISHMGTEFPAGSAGVVLDNAYKLGYAYTVLFDDETLGREQFRLDELKKES